MREADVGVADRRLWRKDEPSMSVASSGGGAEAVVALPVVGSTSSFRLG